VEREEKALAAVVSQGRNLWEGLPETNSCRGGGPFEEARGSFERGKSIMGGSSRRKRWGGERWDS